MNSGVGGVSVDREVCVPRAWSRAMERAVLRVARPLGLDPRSLRVRLVGEAAMAELAERHLGKHGPTDVLAFPDEAGGGDLAICPPVALRQAPFAPIDEILRLLVHGMAHLAGHDHDVRRRARRMLRAERAALRRLRVPDVPRPYAPEGRLRGSSRSVAGYCDAGL